MTIKFRHQEKKDNKDIAEDNGKITGGCGI
jgi:hypothetical protein